MRNLQRVCLLVSIASDIQWIRKDGVMGVAVGARCRCCGIVCVGQSTQAGVGLVCDMCGVLSWCSWSIYAR